MSKFYNIDISTNLGGVNASDIKVSSQKSIKTYIDGSLQTVAYIGSDDSISDIIDSATGKQVDISLYAKKLWVQDQGYLTLQTLPSDLGKQSDWTQTDDTQVDFIKNKPTIPASPGTLNTNISTSQSVSSSEVLSGSISLHKISKTGSYNDLLDKPNFATVATSGSYNDLSNKPATFSMANLCELSFPDSVYIKSATDVQQYLNDNYSSPLTNLYQCASLKPLRFVCDSYQWGELQSDEHYYAEVPVHVLFPDNSELVKTVLFSRSESIGVKLSSVAGYIDTGLTLNYSYEFEAQGYASGGQAVFIDAFASTGIRTALRILGSSNKAQFMWPANSEYTYSTTGIDFAESFTYVQKYNSLTLTQGATTYTATISNSTSSGTNSAKIFLLNSAANSYSYGNGVLYYAIIRDSNGNVLRHFKPYYIENNELVLIDVANDNTVYRPNEGELLPVE